MKIKTHCGGKVHCLLGNIPRAIIIVMAKVKFTEAEIQLMADSLHKKIKPNVFKFFDFNVDYSKYQQDPVGFCENELGETLTDDIKIMMESVRDNEVTVAVSANATGKTHAAARIAVWFYKAFEECKVFTAAAPPIDNLRNLLWGEIGAVIRENQKLFKGQVQTSLDIRESPNVFLIGVTIPSAGTSEEREAKFSGKHQRNMLFVLDEGDAIPDDCYRGIESCMSGGNSKLLIMFNPRKSSGAVYRMIKDKEANVVYLSAFNHPNVLYGADIIPGAVTREKTIQRVNRWTRPFRDGDVDSESTTYDLPKCLEGVSAKRKDGTDYAPLVPGKYKIINPAFSYMVLGRYPAQGSDQLISEEWIAAARLRYDTYTAEYGESPPSGAKGIMGLDVAEQGDDSNVVYGRYDGYLTQPASWGGVDPAVTGDKAMEWYKGHPGIYKACVDGTGVGAGVAPHMQRTDGIVAVSVKVASKPVISCELGDFRILRDELLWRVREWLRTNPNAMLPDCAPLLEQLLCPTYCTDSGRVEVLKTADMKVVLGCSPDHLMALAMTFYGSTSFFGDCDFEEFPPDE